MGACMNSKEGKKNPVAAFFGAIGKFFKEFGEAAAKGDGAVKASLLVAGAGFVELVFPVMTAIVESRSNIELDTRYQIGKENKSSRDFW